MNTVARSAMTVALMGGAMYFLDPVSGHRRRVILRDQCSRIAKRLDDGTRDTRHELSHRIHDVAAQTQARLARDQTSDKAINAHVCEALGEAVSHPGAIGVAVHEGNVYLRGDMLTHEHQRALNAVRSVHGVRIVTDHLTTREAAEGVRPLQNGDGKGDAWSVVGRVFVGATSCALLLWGVRERKALGALGASAGHALRRISKQEVDEGIEGIQSAFEAGVDEAKAIARDADIADSDVADGVRTRQRQSESAPAVDVRTQAVIGKR